MWSRASGVSNHDLIHFHVAEDLVLVRSGPTTYGTIIFGKIRIPAIQDGYVHVRIHDPPNQASANVSAADSQSLTVTIYFRERMMSNSTLY